MGTKKPRRSASNSVKKRDSRTKAQLLCVIDDLGRKYSALRGVPPPTEQMRIRMTTLMQELLDCKAILDALLNNNAIAVNEHLVRVIREYGFLDHPKMLDRVRKYRRRKSP